MQAGKAESNLRGRLRVEGKAKADTMHDPCNCRNHGPEGTTRAVVMQTGIAGTPPETEVSADTAADKTTPTEVPSLEGSAHFLSVMFLLYPIAIVLKGFKRRLELEDLPALPKQDEATILHARFMAAWALECAAASKAKRAASIQTAIWKVIRLKWVSATLLLFLGVACQLLGPVILQHIILFLEQSESARTSGTEEPPIENGLLWVLFMVIVLCIDAITKPHAQLSQLRMGCSIRSIFASVVFHESLELTNEARQSTTTGQMVNLMSADADKFKDSMGSLQMA